MTREWLKVATPVVTALAEFTGSETKVELTCATPGALICYMTNGNEPTSHSPKYTGPFWVTEGCTVKACAVCDDYLTSDVTSFTITRNWCIGDTMGVPDHAFTTSGDATFYRVNDATAPAGEAMHSGLMRNSAQYGSYNRSALTTTVMGQGTLSFMWRTSCEEDDEFEWDHAEFVAEHDAATAHLGVPWRLPTDAEFAALISNCTSMWVGNGCLFTGKGAYASKSILLPAAGFGNDARIGRRGSGIFYMSSSVALHDSYDAWALEYYKTVYRDLIARCAGVSVRPVRDCDE